MAFKGGPGRRDVSDVCKSWTRWNLVAALQVLDTARSTRRALGAALGLHHEEHRPLCARGGVRLAGCQPARCRAAASRGEDGTLRCGCQLHRRAPGRDRRRRRSRRRGQLDGASDLPALKLPDDHALTGLGDHRAARRVPRDCRLPPIGRRPLRLQAHRLRREARNAPRRLSQRLGLQTLGAPARPLTHLGRRLRGQGADHRRDGRRRRVPLQHAGARAARCNHRRRVP